MRCDRAATLALLLLLAGACGGSDESEVSGRSAAGAPAPAPEVSPEEQELLAALGYVYFAREKATEAGGVVRLDRDRAQPGYSLYSIRYRCRAELIDLDGSVVHAWEHRPCRFWSTAELLPSGDLLVTGLDPTGDARQEVLGSMYLMRLRWDGSVAWKLHVPAHHDAELTPRGEILTLVARYRELPAVFPNARVKDEYLTLLTPEGEHVAEASILDILGRAGRRFRLRRVPARDRDGSPAVELFHANSVEWIDQPGLAARSPLYGPDRILTCLRNQNSIAIIDWKRKALVWAWGRGELELPHHPTVLPNGNILVFDNGVRARRSRVLEVDPASDEIVWQYVGSEADPFFSENRGSNQRLANGNTLIADSDSGRAFEVTPSGEIVWEFLTPYLDDAGHRATIERIQRYPADAIAARLGREGAERLR